MIGLPRLQNPAPRATRTRHHNHEVAFGVSDGDMALLARELTQVLTLDDRVFEHHRRPHKIDAVVSQVVETRALIPLEHSLLASLARPSRFQPSAISPREARPFRLTFIRSVIVEDFSTDEAQNAVESRNYAGARVFHNSGTKQEDNSSFMGAERTYQKRFERQAGQRLERSLDGVAKSDLPRDFMNLLKRADQRRQEQASDRTASGKTSLETS